MDGWHDFMTAQAGASAALAGLIFVGLSINLDRILKLSAVLARTAAALLMLLGVLVTSSLMLVPDQSLRSAGVQVLLVAGVIWGLVTVFSVTAVRGQPPEYQGKARGFLVLRQVATLLLVVAGAILTLGNDDGLQWMVRAYMVTYFATMVEAWVILVEIDR
ncbi:MAG: hypothetical protein ACTHQE_03785 [Thermomicrobiales bacterium]